MHEMHRAVDLDWIYYEFRFCCKSVFYSKTVITFAYKLGFRRILYRFVSTEKVRLGSEQYCYFCEIYICEIRPKR